MFTYPITSEFNIEKQIKRVKIKVNESTNITKKMNLNLLIQSQQTLADLGISF